MYAFPVHDRVAPLAVGAVLLTGVECVATMAIGAWNRSDNVAYLALGIVMFAGVGAIFACAARFAAGNVYVVNALWQATSIPVVTVASCVLLREEINPLHIVGVAFATMASACFVFAP